MLPGPANGRGSEARYVFFNPLLNESTGENIMKRLSLVCAALLSVSLAYAADAPKKKVNFPTKTIVLPFRSPPVAAPTS